MHGNLSERYGIALKDRQFLATLKVEASDDIIEETEPRTLYFLSGGTFNPVQPNIIAVTPSIRVETLINTIEGHPDEREEAIELVSHDRLGEGGLRADLVVDGLPAHADLLGETRAGLCAALRRAQSQGRG